MFRHSFITYLWFHAQHILAFCCLMCLLHLLMRNIKTYFWKMALFLHERGGRLIKKNIAHNSLEFQVLCYKMQWNKNIDTHWKKIRGPCLNKCLQASCLKYTNYKWGNEKSSCRRKVCYWVNIGSLKFLGLVTTELQLKKLHSFTPICLQRWFRHGTCLNTCNVLELVFCAWKVRLMLWQFDNQNLSWEIILNLFKI